MCDGLDYQFSLILPDVSKQEMESLLALFYCGTVNIYKSELAGIISLTNLLPYLTYSHISYVCPP